MKKRVALIITLIFGLMLIACGSSEKKLSAERCKSLMESAGVSDMETVVEGTTFLTAVRLEEDFKDRDVANLVTEMAGVEKKYYYSMTYTLGDNKEQAVARCEEYVNYLIDQGYEYSGECSIDLETLEFYVKGTDVIIINVEPWYMRWEEQTEVQYSTFIYLY